MGRLLYNYSRRRKRNEKLVCMVYQKLGGVVRSIALTGQSIQQIPQCQQSSA